MNTAITSSYHWVASIQLAGIFVWVPTVRLLSTSMKKEGWHEHSDISMHARWVLKMSYSTAQMQSITNAHYERIGILSEHPAPFLWTFCWTQIEASRWIPSLNGQNRLYFPWLESESCLWERKSSLKPQMVFVIKTSDVCSFLRTVVHALTCLKVMHQWNR